jgi:hypothetical protein
MSETLKRETEETPDEDDPSLVSRPVKEIFHKAMAGSGQVMGAALVYDYPWITLGSGVFVDVGAGVGKYTLTVLNINTTKLIVKNRRVFYAIV